MVANRAELTKMVQSLSDKDIPLVYNLLTRLITHPKEDQYIPYDDEPLTEDDLEAIKEAEEDYKHRRTVRFEDIDNEI